MDERPLRPCMSCGQVDTHPRHTIGLHPDSEEGKPDLDKLKSIDLSGVPPQFVEQFFSGTSTTKHHDCCAADGCEVCQATEEANGGKRYDELTAAMLEHDQWADFVSPNDVEVTHG